MHDIPIVVTNVRGVSLSVTRLNLATPCRGHSVQHLPNHFGTLFYVSAKFR